MVTRQSSGELEQIKLHAARFVWKRRHKKTSKGVPWPEWFFRMFGEQFSDYVERMKRE